MARRARRACEGAARGTGPPQATEPGSGAEPRSSQRVTYDVTNRILAAVMPEPRRPIEIREFPRPDLRTRISVVAHGAVRGVRHGRSPLARAARRCPVSDHPRPRVRRDARVDTRHDSRHRRIDASRRRSRGVLRCPQDMRPLPRLHRASHADEMYREPRLRHHRFGLRWTVRRLVAAHLSRTWRWDRQAP